MFLSKQKPANRNVVLPATLLDQQRLTDPGLAADTTFEVTNMQQHIPGGSQTQAAITARRRASLHGGRRKLAGVRPQPTSTHSSVPPAPPQTQAHEVGSGQFGGTLECGVATVNGIALTTCASIDSAAAVIVIASNSNPSQLSVITRQVIGSVEQQG